MYRHCFLAVAVLLLVGAGLASAQQKVGELRAVGEVTVYVMPDTAQVSFTVRGEDKALSAARQQAAQISDRITAAIDRLKIDGLTMNTESITVNPLYAPEKNGDGSYYDNEGGETARKTVGYRVRNSLSVKIAGDPEKLKRGTAQVIDAALTAGAASLDGPYFTKEDTLAAQQEAIAKATKNAVDNLQAMARGMGVAVSRVVSASLYAPDGAEYSYQRLGGLAASKPPAPLGAGGDGYTPMQVEVEAISVGATVWATAEYALPGG